MFVIKKTVFLLVGVIVLLHAVVHHEHMASKNGPELNPKTYYTSFSSSFFRSFALNQGDGHLEHYIDCSFDAPEMILNEVLVIDYSDETGSFTNTNAMPVFVHDLYLPQDPLRGPPNAGTSPA